MTKLAAIQSAIRKLSPRDRTELRRWVLAANDEGLDLDTDSPGLESELLKVAEEPFAAYSREEIRSVCERVAREVRRK